MSCNDAFEYPRFFSRQIITHDDLNLVMTYLRTKMRQHNLSLHGWGVVCGAKVCLVMKDGKAEPWKVRVEPGEILGPYGDEILIDCARTVDLRTSGVTGVTGEPCVDVPDPWCSEVFVPCERTGPFYIAVRYSEVMARPVRVQPLGCGCDDTACEYSRWRDGYEIGILRECPQSEEKPPKIPDCGTHAGSLPECPPCPENPWVVLAMVDMDSNGVIMLIDNCSCRRLVISFSEYWWRCQSDSIRIGDVKINGTSLDKKSLTPGQNNLLVTVNGGKFKEGVKVYLGSGVSICNVQVKDDGGNLEFKINIDDDAALGPRTLVVQNPDCSVGVLQDAITIIKQTQQ